MELEERIGYKFRDRALLTEALTHRSQNHDSERGGPHNERLEFLGDAVLGFVASERLMSRFPEYPEGRLTKVKAQLVCSAALYRAAQQLELSEQLLLGRAEERNGGRTKKAIQADAVEALIAAIYLDGGVEPAASFIDEHLLSPDQITDADENFGAENAKSALQELLQGMKLPLPSYEIVAEEGPPHNRIFSIELSIGDLYRARATGFTKKAAEQSVAATALEARETWLPATADAPAT